MEIPSTELGSVELGARVAADPAGVASAPAPGAAVSDATAVADAPIALAAADSVERAAADNTLKRDTSSAARDTAALRLLAAAAEQTPRPSRPAPPHDIVVAVSPLTPLKAGMIYRVTAINIRGLGGAPRTSDRVLTIPVARADTTRRPERP